MAHDDNYAVQLQRAYYANTAATYESEHVHEDDEHYVALAILSAMIEHYGCRSVLDVGSGTGRCLRYLKKKFPDIRIVGIEPSPELRQIGYESGISQDELIDGNALSLGFPDNYFDIVCEFGVLHHLNKPRVAVNEMLRVSKQGIFISDDNHFASGPHYKCVAKRFLKALGLWEVAYWLKTKGKGYGISKGDGLSYAYSVFDDLTFIKTRCAEVFITNTKGCGPDLFKNAPNIAIFAKKNGN